MKKAHWVERFEISEVAEMIASIRGDHPKGTTTSTYGDDKSIVVVDSMKLQSILKKRTYNPDKLSPSVASLWHF